MNSLVIIGSGAHARRVGYLARSAGWNIAAFIDEAPDHEATLLGVAVVANVADVDDASKAVVAIGDAKVRSRIQSNLLRRGFECVVLVHPRAWVSPDVKLARGTVVLAGAVIESGAEIGEGTILDIGALVDHDVSIGEFCHIKPGTVIESGARIEAYAVVR